MESSGVFLAALLVFQLAAAVEVDEGAESVVLHCCVNSSDLTDLAVVWSREDLNPPYVHYKNNGTDQSDKQNQQYQNRTSVTDPLREEGCPSLTLIKPQGCDSASYTCIVRRKGVQLYRTEEQLQVKEPALHQTCILLGAVLGVLLVVTVVLGALVVCLWRRKTSAVCQVKVKEGVRCVELPCQFTGPLPEDATVEWSLSGPEFKVAHRYDNGRDQLRTQHRSYQESTVMRNPPQDLGLTLTDPRHADSGIYVCTILRDGHILAQTVVELQVQHQFWTQIRDCMLRRKDDSLPTESNLSIPQSPDDTRLEMSLSDPEPTSPRVCQYENGRNQVENQHRSTGDFVLTRSDSSHHFCPGTRGTEMIIPEKNDDGTVKNKDSTVTPFF